MTGPLDESISCFLIRVDPCVLVPITYRRLHVLAIKGLHVLAIKGLYALTFKGLHVLTFRGLHVVATYPLAGGRRVTRGCVFQERKMRGVATNVYSMKMSEKPERCGLRTLSERFGSCIYARGRY